MTVAQYNRQDWQPVQQSVHSEGTSLDQIPSLHKHIAGQLHGVNLDMGGGAYDKATQFLAQHGVKNLVYDPYNRPPQHNQQVMAAVAGGRADSVTLANVLNVIPEPAAQLQTLKEAADALKPGGTVYIDVYPGNGSGHPEKTSKGFQQNKPLQAYLPLVQQVFPQAKLTHSMIVAQNGGGQQQNYARVSDLVEQYAKLGPAAGQMNMFTPTVTKSGAMAKRWQEELHPRTGKGVGDGGKFQSKHGGGQHVRVVDHGTHHVAHVQHPQSGEIHQYKGHDHAHAVRKAAVGSQNQGFTIENPKPQPEMGGLFAGHQPPSAGAKKPQPAPPKPAGPQHTSPPAPRPTPAAASQQSEPAKAKATTSAGGAAQPNLFGEQEKRKEFKKEWKKNPDWSRNLPEGQRAADQSKARKDMDDFVEKPQAGPGHEELVKQAQGWNHSAMQHEGTLPDNKAKLAFSRTTGKSDLDKWLMKTHGVSDTDARAASNKAGEEGPAPHSKLPETHWSHLPKEGDTKSEGGHTYTLKSGRWHRSDAEGREWQQREVTTRATSSAKSVKKDVDVRVDVPADKLKGYMEDHENPEYHGDKPNNRMVGAAKKAIKNLQDKNPLFADQVSDEEGSPQERAQRNWQHKTDRMNESRKGFQDEWEGELDALKNLTPEQQKDATRQWNDHMDDIHTNGGKGKSLHDVIGLVKDGGSVSGDENQRKSEQLANIFNRAKDKSNVAKRIVDEHGNGVKFDPATLKAAQEIHAGGSPKDADHHKGTRIENVRPADEDFVPGTFERFDYAEGHRKGTTGLRSVKGAKTGTADGDDLFTDKAKQHATEAAGKTTPEADFKLQGKPSDWEVPDSQKPDLPNQAPEKPATQSALFDAGKKEDLPGQSQLFDDPIDPDNSKTAESQAKAELDKAGDAPKGVTDAESVKAMMPGAKKRQQAEQEAGVKGRERVEENNRWAENHIKIAADDISKLRKTDVHRVLDGAPYERRGHLENWIQKQRPDLSAEVNEVAHELDVENAARKDKEEGKTAEPEIKEQHAAKYKGAFLDNSHGEQQKGFPKMRETLRSWDGDQLEKKRKELVRDSMGGMFGHNAKKSLNVVEDVIKERRDIEAAGAGKAEPEESAEKFMTASEAVMAGKPHGGYERPISDAFVNERIDEDHPAMQGRDKVAMTDYFAAQKVANNVVHGTWAPEHNHGKVTGFSDDLKNAIVERDGFKQEIPVNSLENTEDLLKHRNKSGKSSRGKHFEYLTSTGGGSSFTSVSSGKDYTEGVNKTLGMKDVGKDDLKLLMDTIPDNEHPSLIDHIRKTKPDLEFVAHDAAKERERENVMPKFQKAIDDAHEKQNNIWNEIKEQTGMSSTELTKKYGHDFRKDLMGYSETVAAERNKPSPARAKAMEKQKQRQEMDDFVDGGKDKPAADYGDIVKTKDGVVGRMRGGNGIGGNRVGVIDEKGNKHFASRDELSTPESHETEGKTFPQQVGEVGRGDEPSESKEDKPKNSLDAMAKALGTTPDQIKADIKEKDKTAKLEKLEQQRVDLNKQGAKSRGNIVAKQRKRADLDERIQREREKLQKDDKPSGASIGDQLQDKHKLDKLSVSERKDHIALENMRVAEDQRGQGTGSKVIKDLQEHATKSGKPIVLTAEPDTGKKAALDRFYKSHGFSKPGRKKDFGLPQHSHVWHPPEVEGTAAKAKANKAMDDYVNTVKGDSSGYDKRVKAEEAKGLTRGDAQGVVDAEIMQENRKPESKAAAFSPETHGGYKPMLKMAQDIDSGKMTADEFKAAHKMMHENSDAFRADLQKRYSAQQLKNIAGRFHDGYARGNTKEANARSVHKRLMEHTFDIGDGMSRTYSMNEIGDPNSSMNRLEAHVAKQTDETMAAHVEDRKKATAEREESNKASAAALENPEKLDDFKRVERKAEGYANMKPEHQVKYDELRAEQTRGQRAKEKNATEVKGFDKTEEQHFGKTGIVEGHHTKQDKPTWTVTTENRISNEMYREQDIRGKSRQLGGKHVNARTASRYGATEGFQFFNKEDAENFEKTLNGDKVDRSGRLDRRKEEREKTVSEKLTAHADRLEGRGEESHGADRKENTHKRAREAASARASAAHDMNQAKRLRSVSEAMDAGKANHLNGMSALTHMETLQSVWKQANRTHLEKQLEEKHGEDWQRKASHDERENAWQQSELEDGAIAHAKMPRQVIYKNNVAGYLQKAAGTTGLKMDAKRWMKRFEKTSNSVDKDHFTMSKEATREWFEFANNAKRKGVSHDWGGFGEKDHFQRLYKMGIQEDHELRAALREFSPHQSQKDGRGKIDPVEALEKKLHLEHKAEGFYPTPPQASERAVELADIQDGHDVYEPHAGSGRLMDAIKAKHGDSVKLTGGEMHGSLMELLKMKGHDVEQGDFLEHKGQHDRIVMNPPFENNQAIDHVQHGFKQLAPGGKLVAVVPGNDQLYRGATQKKRKAFSDFVDEHGEFEELPAGSFKGADAPRQTGVNTSYVVLTKPGKENYSRNVFTDLLQNIGQTDVITAHVDRYFRDEWWCYVPEPSLSAAVDQYAQNTMGQNLVGGATDMAISPWGKSRAFNRMIKSAFGAWQGRNSGGQQPTQQTTGLEQRHGLDPGQGHRMLQEHARRLARAELKGQSQTPQQGSPQRGMTQGQQRRQAEGSYYEPPAPEWKGPPPSDHPDADPQKLFNFNSGPAAPAPEAGGGASRPGGRAPAEYRPGSIGDQLQQKRMGADAPQRQQQPGGRVPAEYRPGSIGDRLQRGQKGIEQPQQAQQQPQPTAADKPFALPTGIKPGSLEAQALEYEHKGNQNAAKRGMGSLPPGRIVAPNPPSQHPAAPQSPGAPSARAVGPSNKPFEELHPRGEEGHSDGGKFVKKGQEGAGQSTEEPPPRPSPEQIHHQQVQKAAHAAAVQQQKHVEMEPLGLRVNGEKPENPYAGTALDLGPADVMATQSQEVDPQTSQREFEAKQAKARAMREHAEKQRQTPGTRMHAEDQKRQDSNYTGKRVGVHGKMGEVIGHAFGKAKIKFDDGTEKVHDANDIHAPLEQKNAPQAPWEKSGNISKGGGIREVMVDPARKTQPAMLTGEEREAALNRSSQVRRELADRDARKSATADFNKLPKAAAAAESGASQPQPKDFAGPDGRVNEMSYTDASGKKVEGFRDAMKKFNSKERQHDNRRQDQHQDKIKAAATSAGVNPVELHQIAQQTHEMHMAEHKEWSPILQQARNLVSSSKAANIENSRDRAGAGDYSNVAGYDEMLDEMMNNNPHLNWGDNPADTLWQKIKGGGKAPTISDDKILRESLDYLTLEQNRLPEAAGGYPEGYEPPDHSGGYDPDDPDAVPFSRHSDMTAVLDRYMRPFLTSC